MLAPSLPKLDALTGLCWGLFPDYAAGNESGSWVTKLKPYPGGIVWEGEDGTTCCVELLQDGSCVATAYVEDPTAGHFYSDLFASGDYPSGNSRFAVSAVGD